METNKQKQLIKSTNILGLLYEKTLVKIQELTPASLGQTAILNVYKYDILL